ncbi:MAG TPA: DNA-binding response regulator [Anaerolineaceae bacterium]|uniref:OmpR family two-component response regulator n=1 Tax=Anaerolinea thermophila TaxID=167964 RepID=A0A117LH53_9CHLR|nr:MAG: OmpR family two-component response regulator [Anaerolinea thermophila]HAF61830.1 DNA-binding response regulator [Anaerolineaceae bacterium]
MIEKILVVEDDLTLQETLVYNLSRQGYAVETASDGNMAVEIVQQNHPDLILLDIMLPGMDGFEVCRIIRKNFTIPILMLTARDDEIDRVVGLEVGADDYLTKPFSMRELIARVKALLRRSRIMQEDQQSQAIQKKKYIFNNLEIDQDRREVTISGKVVEFKPKEYELLIYFAENKGHVLSREQILEKVWGWDYFGDSRTVDVHVRWLREKIEKDPASPQRILTVRSAGYRFDG